MHLRGTQTGVPKDWDSDGRYSPTMFRTIAKFKAGGDPNWQLIAEEWPMFLYDEEAGWSEANIRKGLFRGHVLVRVCNIHFHIVRIKSLRSLKLPL